ncbi:hypothetical protein [Streptomyces sp. NPDC059262]|uniref:hypothetical protein n=1 Tax=Streptomyces sp. NPDC059262 TaxID=3346797 RepID=UPI0036B56357
MSVNLVVLGKAGQTSEHEGEVLHFVDDKEGQFSYSIDDGALLVWKADPTATRVEVAYAPHAWIKASGTRKDS